MRHWTFWEWVAYAALFVAAMIVAADTGIRLAPDLAALLPNFTHGMLWGLAPGALVLLATLILLVREFGRKSQPRSVAAPAVAQTNNVSLPTQTKQNGVVSIAGFQFFPDRPSLHQAHGTLGHRLRLCGVSSVSALLVVGTKFYRGQENLGMIKQLLLPDPNSDGLKWFAKTIDGEDTSRVIKETTKLALKAGAKVKWYNHFNFHSIILADTDKPSGWVHVETVLPYSKPERRPSYTVHKQQSEETVQRDTADISRNLGHGRRCA